MKANGNPELQLNEIFIVYPFTVISITIGLFCSGKLMRMEVPAKQIIILGFLVFLPSLFICSLVPNFYAFIFLFGFMSNFGFGLFYSILVYVAVKCYPEKQGLVTGLVMFTVGAGSVFFTILSTSIINPDDKKPNIIEYEGSIRY